MQKLGFQDAFFLRAESPSCPFHVASLMVLSPPENASPRYMKNLAELLGRLPEVWPVFGRRLSEPDSERNMNWIEDDDYDPKDHVLHYRLPEPGSIEDLLDLTARAHEQLLDRYRPLWQAHLIEGLPKGQFAVYFKVHHALIDGVGGLRLIKEMFTTDPNGRLLDLQTRHHRPRSYHHDEESLGEALKHSIGALFDQAKAASEAYGMLANMGLDSLLGKKDRPQAPFSAPHSLLNEELSSRRRFIICELPLKKLHAIGQSCGGTINDVLVAVCGHALREYLLDIGSLPNRSLDAGLPVSIKSAGQDEGNQLSFIICPFATDEKDPVKRLKRVVKTTKKAKWDLSHISPMASEDLATMTMIPFLLVSLTHSSQRFPPVFNTIVSNVPGARKTLYLEGAKLERLYPLSVVTDGMGLNITAISYGSKMCLGITAAPSSEPGIETLGARIKAAYKVLNQRLLN